MTKRPDTGAASVSPCPTCAYRTPSLSVETDGGKSLHQPERTGGSKSPTEN